MTISWTASCSDIELPLPQVDHQPRYRIWTREVFQREQVILGPNGIPNLEEAPRAGTRDGVILRHPVRTAVTRPLWLRWPSSVVRGRRPEPPALHSLRPPAQNPLKLVVNEGNYRSWPLPSALRAASPPLLGRVLTSSVGPRFRVLGVTCSRFPGT